MPWRCVGPRNGGVNCPARAGPARLRGGPGPPPRTRARRSFRLSPRSSPPVDPLQRYKQLLHFAGRLAPLPAELRTREHKVQGCVSQVWVVPCLGADGRLSWRADSDSQLTKGLAALLVEGLSGLTPEQVAAMSPSFIQDLGFAEALTPSRNNGFLNMFKLMQRRALEYCLQRHGEDSNGASGRDEPIGGASGRDEPASPAAAHPTPAAPSGNGAVEQVPAPSSAPAEGAEPPFAQAVRTALQAELDPIRCCVGAGCRGQACQQEVCFSVASLETRRHSCSHAAPPTCAPPPITFPPQQPPLTPPNPHPCPQPPTHAPNPPSPHPPTHTLRLSLTPAAMEKLQILVVSPRFAGLSTMKRQRLVHAALAKGLDGGAPAVSITALAPGEPGST